MSTRPRVPVGTLVTTVRGNASICALHPRISLVILSQKDVRRSVPPRLTFTSQTGRHASAYSFAPRSLLFSATTLPKPACKNVLWVHGLTTTLVTASQSVPLTLSRPLLTTPPTVASRPVRPNPITTSLQTTPGSASPSARALPTCSVTTLLVPACSDVQGVSTTLTRTVPPAGVWIYAQGVPTTRTRLGLVRGRV